jgi:oligopeptidase A
LRPSDVQPAISQLLDHCRALVARLSSDAVAATWADFAAPLGDGFEQLSRAWGIVGHVHSVNDVPAWRDAYNGMLPEVSRFYAEVGQNVKLFAKYKAIAGSAEYAGLSAAQRRVIENELRDFRLSGAELAEDSKPRFQAISEELAQLSAKFSENLLDTTNAFAELVTDEAELAGLPDDARQAAREAAEQEGKSGWKFTLHMPSYLPVMQYADSRRLRAAMYRAYATRAAEFGAVELDNTPLIRRILELRREQAQMLGYANFAEVSLVPKMAESVPQVLCFLRDLAVRARPFAEKDVADLRAFARDQLALATMEPWDIGYVSEKLLQARYAFSEQEVKQYFTEDKVLAGLFSVIESLFGVHLKPDCAPVWHEDVRFFRIETPAGELIGQFYLDLYARPTKRGGAWMDEAIGRRRIRQESLATSSKGIQRPVAYLNCNFSRPIGERDGKARPAIFTHDEVSTLFHETGHGLHHLLTQVDELGVAGIHGVEWGCRRVAIAIHGELLLGVACSGGHDRPYRYRPAAATRPVRQDACGEELPERPADAPPGGVFALRPAVAQRLRSGRRTQRARTAGRRPARSGGPGTTRMAPLPEQLRAHLRRGLRRRLLQLQVGRGPFGRLLRRF